jgi:transcriptional regulator
MNLQEIIEKLNNREATRKELAEQLGMSDTTLSRRIKSAGYVFSNSTKTYALANGINSPITSTINEPIVKNSDNASNSDNVDEIKNDNKDNSKKASKKDSNTISEIKALIKGTSKSTPTRIYKGIYFDPDIADFLDNIQHGNKSELVNKILRQYLIENGLM